MGPAVVLHSITSEHKERHSPWGRSPAQVCWSHLPVPQGITATCGLLITTLADTGRDPNFQVVPGLLQNSHSSQCLGVRERPELFLPRVFNLIAGLRPELGACFVVSFAQTLHKSPCIFRPPGIV